MIARRGIYVSNIFEVPSSFLPTSKHHDSAFLSPDLWSNFCSEKTKWLSILGVEVVALILAIIGAVKKSGLARWTSEEKHQIYSQPLLVSLAVLRYW
jgi:hypothetical protein